MEGKNYFWRKVRSLSRTTKSFPLIFRDGMLCTLCCITTQTTFGIQQRLLVLELLEIVGCGNLTRTIAVLTALS